MKLTINSTSYSNQTVYFYVIGLLNYVDNNNPGCWSYLKPDGTPQECLPSDNGSDGFADYAIPLSSSTTVIDNFPKLTSGRIYFSINDKLKIKVTDDPKQPHGHGIALPAGWVQDPNYNILFDCIEFTYNAGGMNCDTTQVDMFSLPIAVQLIGQQSQIKGKMVAGGRSQVFSDIKANPDFAKLVVQDSRNNDLRVIAPGHGIEANTSNTQYFSPCYLDSYIETCWTNGNTYTVTVKGTGSKDDGTYIGAVTGGVLNFYRDGDSSKSTVCSIPQPSTKDVFYCNGVFDSPNDVTGAIKAAIGAALNRTILFNNSQQPICDPTKFYQAETTNFYSKVLHQYYTDGDCYGFPWDDVCDIYSSDLSDPAPTELILTLEAF